LREREHFPSFKVFGEFFPVEPPARSAILNELLVDVTVEVEVVTMALTTSSSAQPARRSAARYP
jgi:hypothetical protein